MLALVNYHRAAISVNATTCSGFRGMALADGACGALSLTQRYPKARMLPHNLSETQSIQARMLQTRLSILASMKLQLTQLPKLIADRRSTAVFGVVIIAMLWGGICLKYIQDIRSDEREAERTNQNFAMVFEENVLRSIGEIDKSLLYLRRTIETRQDTDDFHTIVSTADLLSEIIVQVAIIDAKGIMRASNAGPQPAPAIDLSDREHYRVHLNSSDDRLFISKPVIGRASGQWSVQFTRRFLNREGKFGGVVVTSLNLAHLTDFYNRIDFGSSTSIALIGQDGVVRSSGGGSGGFELGQDLSNTTMFRRAQSAASPTFDDVDPATGQTRLVTFRQVRGHPLLVSVSLD
jgi:hypothetical protein